MLRRTVGDEEIGQTLEHVVGSEPSGNNDCQAAARELVEHDQHAESATVLCPILDEVVRPDVVRTLRSETNARARRTPASGKGLVFSLESFLQDQFVDRQLGDSPLQALVLAIEILETLGLVELQTAVLAPPAIIALLRDAEASTDRANRLTLSETDLRFPQKTDDLLCRVSLPCHSLLSSIEVGNSRIRSINLVSLQGSTPVRSTEPKV